MKKFDVLDGDTWIQVNETWLKGVNNIQNIKNCTILFNNKLQVNYKYGKIVYYQYVHRL